MSATSSFALDTDNQDPSGLATDGSVFWVTDDQADTVFVYATDGMLLGQWQLDASNADPSGITNEPGGRR